MGKLSTGEKPKFDLITASKTKKYKIITAVILVIGILLLGGGLLMRNFVTAAVTPNNLKIDALSGWQGGENYVISIDESFILSTGNVQGRPLNTPITFELRDGADKFMEVCNAKYNPVKSSYYAGVFYLHIRDDAPATVDNGFGEMVNPTGTLVICCGSHSLTLRFTYQAVK